MSLDQQETLYRIILTAFLMPLLLSGILIWFLIFYQKKKYRNQLERKDLLLREQKLIIEKQEAIQQERNRIASEMHDDLGSGLTTIKYLSERALKQARDPEDEKEVRKIAAHSSQLVRNMSEIIWAMNTRYDSLENLVAYIRRYASEYLEEHRLPLTFESLNGPYDQAISGERRRNLFLVVKELLHNSVKHSGAKAVSIRCDAATDFIMDITEKGGTGFDPAISMDKGNGLYNIQKRLLQAGASIEYRKSEEGMHFILRHPIEEGSSHG